MIETRFRQTLNNILTQIATNLDLDETRYNNAVSKYSAVADWLNADGSSLASFAPDIYPHGSLRLGTSVRPFTQPKEYDVDLVCLLFNTGNLLPSDLKKRVGARLDENKTYMGILEEKNRCWRLNFAGEFHMDILPAIPAGGIGTAILIPDKSLQGWKDSDPKGYAAWFFAQMQLQFEELRESIARVKNKSIEDVPEQEIKTTLQKSVQLIKRNRDIHFEGNPWKPAGIISSTIAGHAYTNEPDLFEALTTIVQNGPNYIQSNGTDVVIPNPVNPGENFTDKWEDKPGYLQQYLAWNSSLHSQLLKLAQAGSLQTAEPLLNEMFGERITKQVLKEMGQQLPPVPITPSIKIERAPKPWRRI